MASGNSAGISAARRAGNIAPSTTIAKDAAMPDAKATKPPAAGMSKGLTSYGDAGFSLFLRKAFIKGAGYTTLPCSTSENISVLLVPSVISANFTGLP